MAQRMTDDRLIAAIAERAENSDNKDKVYAYIAEVAENCARLCAAGKNIRVLNEYKFMI